MYRGCDNSPPACPLELAREQNAFETFVYVNGRRFQVGDENTRTYLPDDKEEATRRYAQHYVHKHVWKGIYSAPIRQKLMFESAKVLDIGCGTGTWTIDMATEFPVATFIGVDCAPVFPDSRTKPQNVGFLQCNILDGVPFPEGTFDLVKQRDLITNISADWTATVLPEMIRVTVPGGWIEVEEFDCLELFKVGPIGMEIAEAMFAYFDRTGIERVSHAHIKKSMERFELTDVQVKMKKIPIGGWAGKLGELVLDVQLRALKALDVILPSVMGISDREYELKLQQYAKEVNEYQSEIPSYRVLARKPAKAGLFYKLYSYSD